MRVFDSHAHLTDARFKDDLDAVVRNFRNAGGEYILDVAEHLPNAEKCIANARRFDCVYAAVGIHPHNVKMGFDKQKLIGLCAEPKVVAIGEIGLDYHYEDHDKDMQRIIFDVQLETAEKLHLPVIIHSRDATKDTLDILADYAGKVDGVLHCFSGSAETARQCLDMGLYISFAGPLTYPKSERLREVARIVPDDRILVETDCPYLAPQSVRGRRNEPAFVVHTLAALAEIKGRSVEEMGEITVENTKRLFGIV